ncbi:MAG TPA: hypothetical protein VKV39_13580 [Candidatus Sulfotelmatobacter sp.]|nr:hypothetical protein [Candidatus Sulfotelmatobacter sp.]
MKNAILLAVSQRKPFQRALPLCLVAAACLVGAAQAQEKAPESAHAAGWVVIPVEEYRVLRAKAYPAEQSPEPPPVEATLTRVDYDLQIDGEVATGKANLTVDVLKDGWVRVPMPDGLLVREARIDGRLVSLVSATEGKSKAHLSALLSHAGRSVLQLEVDVPIATAAGEESISLPTGGSAVTRAAVELPRQGMDLRVGGGLVSSKAETQGQTKWLAYGHGNEPLTFTWRRRTADHHVDLPLRMRGSLTQLTSLLEDSSSIYGETHLVVTQGAAREARIRLPQNVTINQVAGAVVADWEVKNGELAVTFLEPVEHDARFVITGDIKLPRDGLIDIPLLRLLDTEREEGGVAVEVLGAGEIKGEKTKGLDEADATDLGEMIVNRQSPALAAFRFRTGDAATERSLSLNVARYDQQAVLMANVEEARYQILLSADGKELVQARYAVRNNQRNFLKVTLPSGAAVWSVLLAGKPVRPGQSPDGSLLLPLEKSRGADDAPAFAIEILYFTKATAWQDKGHEKLSLPALDLPISRTGLLLYYPPLFRVSPDPGAFRTQEYENPASAVLMPAREESVASPSAAVSTGRNLGGVIGGPMASPTVLVPKQKSDLSGGENDDKKDAMQAMLDTFRSKSLGGKVTGILPVNVSFPAFGPSIYLVSELTSENQSPLAELSFQRDKKGGVR